MSRYNNIDYILDLEIFDFINLLEKVHESQEKEDLWAMYISVLPHLDPDSEFTNWGYFYNIHTGNEEIAEESKEKNKQGLYIDQLGLGF